MLTSGTLNRIVIPALAALCLGYAAYATDVMRPRLAHLAPLSAPPERPFERTIAGVGLVEPESELIRIGPRVPGWVAAVHVRAGDRVGKDQPLFTLDGVAARAELAARQEAIAVEEARLARLRAFPRPEDAAITAAAVAESASRLSEARNQLGFVERVVDKRAVREEETSQRRDALATAEAALARQQAELDKVLAGAWQQDVQVAEHEVARARAAAARAAADLEQLTVRAPIDGVILKVDVRAGEYAAAGPIQATLIVMGSAPPWCVRVDIDEENARRISPAARAVAMPRGDATTRIEMQFVRFEPYVVPKQALSGHAAERVDTRALQVIYRVADDTAGLLVGEQMDVFVERLDDDRDAASNETGKR